MLSDEWLSRSVGLLENFNASVTRTGTRTRTGKRTGTWTTGVTAIALCTSCSRAKNKMMTVVRTLSFDFFPTDGFVHHVNINVHVHASFLDEHAFVSINIILV